MISQETIRNIIFLIVVIVLSFSCKKDEDTTIKKEKVSGFAQKGPYINGTQILMSELNTQLQQTGNVFSTQIINNQGSFELNDLTLESQFVEFSASGFYFDEVKGGLSSAPLTLYALSDIKDISTVNVNILTHLEKRRVEHLVKNDGKSFSDAKKIAQSEVLAIFGFSNDDMGNSESLEITGEHERNGILLAISVILQARRNVGDLTELLASISDDISTNGLLNNENIIPALEASTRYLNLERIKQNLEGRYSSLGLGVTIPDLEKLIYIFLNRCWPPPTNAEAGPDQYFNDGTTSTTLAANIPVEGTGRWSIYYGEGGSFDDDTKPDAVFTGQPCTFYWLKWTISTECDSSSSYVDIIYDHIPTTANAGPDQYFNDGTISATLAANTPVEGTGKWSIISGEGGSFDDDTKPDAMFIGQLACTNYQLRWTITTACYSSISNVNITFDHTAVLEVLNPATGKTWMDRNLGACRDATSSTDTEAYGDLYQWGRAADGHQKRTSGTTSTLSNNDTPGHLHFIRTHGLRDWRSPQNTNLWQGVNGVNNPCPPGYRLPTEAELNTERLSWSSDNAAGAFASPLKLPVTGFRSSSDGSLTYVGSSGRYWSSTVDGANSRSLSFHSTGARMNTSLRAAGFSVRCLKD